MQAQKAQTQSSKASSRRKLLRCGQSQPQLKTAGHVIYEEINEALTIQNQSTSREGDHNIKPNCKYCEYHRHLAEIAREQSTNLRRQNEFLLEAIRTKTQSSVAVHERDMQIIRLKETVKALTRENGFIVTDLKNQVRQLELRLEQRTADEHQNILRERRQNRRTASQGNFQKLITQPQKEQLNPYWDSITRESEYYPSPIAEKENRRLKTSQFNKKSSKISLKTEPLVPSLVAEA